MSVRELNDHSYKTNDKLSKIAWYFDPKINYSFLQFCAWFRMNQAEIEEFKKLQEQLAQRQPISGYLTLTVRNRLSKGEKKDPLTGKTKEYVSYYLTLSKEDMRSKGLSEGDRITLGIIKVEKEQSPIEQEEKTA